MRNVRLVLEYDGTGFYGWCVQPGKRTIEKELKTAINAVTGEEAGLTVAGRTDTGVHAAEQVVNFYTGSEIPAGKLSSALRKYLPEDITIKEAMDVGLDFDSRRSAKARTYNYLIVNGDFVPVRLKKYAWHFKGNLDTKKMKRAAGMLVGTHNFKSFCKKESYNKTFLRKVNFIKFALSGREFAGGLKYIEIKICANSFLHKMVRVIVGTLVDAGRGKIDPGAIKNILRREDRRFAGRTAPAKGLTLKKVKY